VLHGRQRRPLRREHARIRGDDLGLVRLLVARERAYDARPECFRHASERIVDASARTVGSAISFRRAMISAMVGARSTFCQLREEELVGGASRCA
jgi:hypothetical protein